MDLLYPLRLLYRDSPPWWHFWNLQSGPAGGLLCFFLSAIAACWLHAGVVLMLGVFFFMFSGLAIYALLEIFKPRKSRKHHKP